MLEDDALSGFLPDDQNPEWLEKIPFSGGQTSLFAVMDSLIAALVLEHGCAPSLLLGHATESMTKAYGRDMERLAKASHLARKRSREESEARANAISNGDDPDFEYEYYEVDWSDSHLANRAALVGRRLENAVAFRYLLSSEVTPGSPWKNEREADDELLKLCMGEGFNCDANDWDPEPTPEQIASSLLKLLDLRRRKSVLAVDPIVAYATEAIAGYKKQLEEEGPYPECPF